MPDGTSPCLDEEPNQVSEHDCVGDQDPMSSSLKEVIADDSSSTKPSDEKSLYESTTTISYGIVEAGCDSVQRQIPTSTTKDDLTDDLTDNPPEHENPQTENGTSQMVKTETIEVTDDLTDNPPEYENHQTEYGTSQMMKTQTIEVSNEPENDSGMHDPTMLSTTEELIVENENKERMDDVNAPTKEVLLRPSDAMRTFRKMKSTGMIIKEPEDMCPETNNSFSPKVWSVSDSKTDTCSNTDDEDDESESNLSSKRTRSNMATASSNRTLPVNLDSIDVDYSYSWGKPKICTNNLSNNKSKGIIDSHTSYRVFLEQNAVALKIQLAEAQEKADTLGNDLNLSKKECHTMCESLVDLEIKYAESTRLADGLHTVVTHLQSNAKDCAAERTSLYTQLDEYEREREIMVRSAKQLRFENKKLKKEVAMAKRELEGERMKIQGLKSENEWLKKDAKKSKNDGNANGDDDTGGDALPIAGSGGDALPAIAEFTGSAPPAIADLRQFFKPQKSGENFEHIPARIDTLRPSRKFPPINLSRCDSTTDDDDNIGQFKAISTASHGTRYISFADVHLHPASDEDSCISKDSEIVAQTAFSTTNISPVNKKTDTRRIRRQSSLVARNIFNTLASKHIERSMDVSEDDASQINIPAKGQRRRRKSSGISVMNRLQSSNGANSLGPGIDEGIEKQNTENKDTIHCTTEDLSKRWQDVIESTTPTRKYSLTKSSVDNNHVAGPSTVDISATPSKWNWLWWKNDNNVEDMDAHTKVALQPERQQQQKEPWFLDENNGLPIPPSIDHNERKSGLDVGVSITGGSILSQEGSNNSSNPTGLKNTLVPRRMGNSSFS